MTSEHHFPQALAAIPARSAKSQNSSGKAGVQLFRPFPPESWAKPRFLRGSAALSRGEGEYFPPATANADFAKSQSKRSGSIAQARQIAKKAQSEVNTLGESSADACLARTNYTIASNLEVLGPAQWVCGSFPQRKDLIARTIDRSHEEPTL